MSGAVTTAGSLLVPYDPTRLAARVQGRRRRVVSRVVSLVITVALVVVLWFVADDALRGTGYVTVYGVLLGLSVAWLLVDLVRWRVARRELRRVPEGTALRIGRPGVQVGAVFTPWEQVEDLAVVRPRRARPPVLRLRRTEGGGHEDVALELLDVPPATLDGAARAYSAGRHGVDLAALDN